MTVSELCSVAGSSVGKKKEEYCQLSVVLEKTKKDESCKVLRTVVLKSVLLQIVTEGYNHDNQVK